jgi:hypothetical protein
MKLDPNSRIFDRVPALFVSPFPAADAFADDAFQAFIAKTSGEQTVGQALLTQAAGQAWNHATQMMWKAKATQAGDLLRRRLGPSFLDQRESVTRSPASLPRSRSLSPRIRAPL